MSDKIELKEKIAFVDLNVRAAWDEMTAEQQKSLKKEFFILNRYISSAEGQSREIQEHFVLTVNEYFNKNWNDLQKHPKLLWLLLCMCSYNGEKTFYHNWLGTKKRTGTGGKKIKFLEEIYPNRKKEDLKLLAEINTDKEIKELARKYGMDESTIAEKLK
jgi:hypothetical protein